MKAISEIGVATTPSPAVDRVNILIVDDRRDKLLVFKTLLEDLGENIVTLQSGEDALRWLLENECAVMLLDVNMPGMDGFETAQLIRARRKSAHTPIIFITAHADEMHTAKGYALGAVDYLLTPAAPNVLRSKVAVFVQLFKLTMQIKRQADEHVALAREQAARAAAEELTRRATFLAEVSRVLIGSLDVNSLMVGATRLAVPMLADFSAITLVDGEQTLMRTACRQDWSLVNVSDAIVRQPKWAAAISRVLESGEPVTFGSGAQPHSRMAGDVDDHFHLEHVMMLPLRARGKTYGVLALAAGPSGKRFTNADNELADDIASRVSIALDNCLLFKEIQDSDRRKNEFLATLSHELRNPLAPMRTAIHALHVSGQWPAGAADLREMLERQLKHFTHLVNDVLDVARIRQGKIQLKRMTTDLVASVKYALETCRTVLEDAGHKVSVSLPSEPVMVDGDPVRLQQIFENLLFNASKYTDPRGRIDIELKGVGDEAVFRIRDSGVGIAPDMMGKIWEMFTQVEVSVDRTRHGLGIGLSLAKKLVQLHGGAIEAVSEGLGKGSEFIVRIPLVKAGTETIAAAVPRGEAPVSSDATWRILVVDDNVDAAQSMEVLLGLFGHEVQVAHEGVSALRLARSFNPHLVFLDIGLPGMCGYQIARKLRDAPETSHLKIIALSGYGTESDQARSKEAGFDRHLTKPVDPETIPTVIAMALSG